MQKQFASDCSSSIWVRYRINEIQNSIEKKLNNPSWKNAKNYNNELNTIIIEKFIMELAT